MAFDERRQGLNAQGKRPAISPVPGGNWLTRKYTPSLEEWPRLSRTTKTQHHNICVMTHDDIDNSLYASEQERCAHRPVLDPLGGAMHHF